MKWNWQLQGWPKFKFDSKAVASLEKKFLQSSGGRAALLKHLGQDKQEQFVVEVLCAEGLKSSEIEGEILQRESLQSSIRRHLGLATEKKVQPKEEGMGNLLWNMYTTYDQELTHEMLFEWHKMVMQGKSDIAYRTHAEPMQIVSGRYDHSQVYFEAPPSKDVYKEMTAFIQWFNASRSDESILTRAAIAHVYFESIHPFEDGNGRIGRALIEKALSQHLKGPMVIAISRGIAERRKEYYEALASCNTSLDIQKWVEFFAEVAVQSQEETLSEIHFLMAKSKLMYQLKDKINPRQEKALLRMFAEGIKGFTGGLSAENYIKITKASRATATRDLNDLVAMGALYKTGELKHARYWLNYD
jgi:Fic family protein